MSQNNLLYRVRFTEKDAKKPTEVLVESVFPSEFIGLVTLEGFVFEDQKKFVILPEEDEARKRFGKTQRLHIPYHNIVYVEEFDQEPADLAHLPFVKAVPHLEPDAPNPSSAEESEDQPH